MYNFNKYHNILLKNFTDIIKHGDQISTQFGAYGTEKKEEVMIFNDFNDHNKKKLLIKAVTFSIENNSIFNYLVTMAYIDKREFLIIYSADSTGKSKETSIEIIRDFRDRVSQIKFNKDRASIMPELEALKEAIEI
jgi:hypothetical protein